MYASKIKDVDEKLHRKPSQITLDLVMNDIVFVHQENSIFYVVSCECELWKINCKQIFQPALVWFIVSVYTKDANFVVWKIYLLAYSLKQKNGNKLFWLFSDLFVCLTKNEKMFLRKNSSFCEFLWIFIIERELCFFEFLFIYLIPWSIIFSGVSRWAVLGNPENPRKFHTFGWTAASLRLGPNFFSSRTIEGIPYLLLIIIIFCCQCKREKVSTAAG